MLSAFAPPTPSTRINPQVVSVSMCFFILLSSDHKLPGDPTDESADGFCGSFISQASSPRASTNGTSDTNGTYDERRPKTLPIRQHFDRGHWLRDARDGLVHMDLP